MPSISARLLHRCFCVFAAVLGCVASVRAAPAVSATSSAAAPATWVVEDTLVVVGVRGGDGLELGGLADVVCVELGDAAAGADLADFLEDAAGLRIRRYGGLGASALPSLRGSSAAQVLVLIDGVPLSDAQSGVVDLARLPLDRFVRAEIHRGGVTARLGGGSGAGAINLITRRDSDGGGWQIAGGSFGTVGARGVQAASAGAWRLLASVHGRRADNRFGFLDHNQTFATAADDRPAERVNAWLRDAGASLRVERADGGPVDLRLSAGTYRNDAGVPGPVGSGAAESASVEFRRHDVHAAAASSRGRWALDVVARRETETMDDPDAEIGWDPPGATHSRSDHLDARAWWRLEGGLPFESDGWWELKPAAAWRRQTYARRHEDEADPERERTAVSLGADALIASAATRLSLRASLVRRRHEDDFPPLPALPWLPEEPLAEPNVHASWAPAAVLSWEALPDLLAVDLRASRSERAPTWIELFGHRSGLVGNRDLEPEIVRTREAALRLHPPDGPRVRLAMFRSDVDRAIVWRVNSQFQSLALNIGAAEIRGAEFETTADLSESTSLRVAATSLDARDRGDDPVYAGRRLPHQPRWSLSAGVAHAAGPWDLRAKVVRESASHRDRYNDPAQTVPAHAVVDASVSRRWRRAGWAGGRALRLVCEVLNLNDDDVYDVEGFPLPGRSFRVVLDIR